LDPPVIFTHVVSRSLMLTLLNADHGTHDGGHNEWHLRVPQPLQRGFTPSSHLSPQAPIIN
jgi:hypothetical protein